MKILACLFINSHGNACLPTISPIAIRTSGIAVSEGKYLLNGSLITTDGALTLVISDADSAPNMPEFLFAAGMADEKNGNISNSGLVCDTMGGPVAGELVDIVDGRVTLTGRMSRQCADALPSVPKPELATPPAEEPAAAPLPVDAPAPIPSVAPTKADFTDDKRVIITGGQLGIPFPDEPGPCPVLCGEAPAKPEPQKPAAKPAAHPNHISAEEVETF